MVYRNKTYICFDGDNDMHYYRLMQAWHQSDNTTFTFYNAHDLNTARDTSLESSIKRQLKERLLNTKVFVVLIGASTRYLTKFVKWEMEQALSMRLPLVGVNLNGNRYRDDERCPPTIHDQLCMYVSFKARILEYALENWPQQHYSLVQQRQTGPFYYRTEIYQQLGIW